LAAITREPAIIAAGIFGLARRLMQVIENDAQCRSYGLELGTAAYADCRLRLKTPRL
jgi:hypothetical protein